MDFTTIEKLQLKVSASYGAVIQYGDKVFVTDIHWKGGFTAAIYEFIETPEDAGVSKIECRLDLLEQAKETFKDNGHALAWCFAQVK